MLRLISVLPLFVVIQVCAAAPIALIDQHNEIRPQYAYYQSAMNSIDIGQTLTVGVTGKLTRLEMALYGDSDFGQFTIDVSTRSPNRPPDFSEASVLASTTVFKSAIPSVSDVGLKPSFTAFDFEGGPLVRAGDALAIILRNDAGSVSWWHGVDNNYPGSIYKFFSHSSLALLASAAGYFRSYVAPVPEPSANFLAAACLFGASVVRSCGGSRRRFGCS